MEQAEQVSDVPPVEYVIDPHAVHVPELDVNLCPALHFVHFPVLLSHVLHDDGQAVHVVAVFPSEYVNPVHD